MTASQLFTTALLKITVRCAGTATAGAMRFSNGYGGGCTSGRRSCLRRWGSTLSVASVLPQLEGAYALAVVNREAPDNSRGRHGSPLVLGWVLEKTLRALTRSR